MEQHFAINALHTHAPARAASAAVGAAEWDEDGRADGRTDRRTPKQEDPFIHDQNQGLEGEKPLWWTRNSCGDKEQVKMS